MEMQTLFIGVACCILSAVIIYLISMFSMREKTFEEVMEEQRLRQDEEEKKARNEKKAERGDRKKYKKFKEKNKERAQQLKCIEIVGTPPHTKTPKKKVCPQDFAVSKLSSLTETMQEEFTKLEKHQVKEVNSIPLVANQSANALSSPQKEEKIPVPLQRKQTGSTSSKPVSSGQQNSSLNINYVPDTKPENTNRKSQKIKTPKVDIDTHKVVELQMYGQNTSKKVGVNRKEIENNVALEDIAPKIESKKITVRATQKSLEKNSSSLSPEPIKKEKLKKTTSEKLDSQQNTRKTNETGLDKKATRGDYVSISSKVLEEKRIKDNFEKEKIEQELARIKVKSSKDAKQHEEECQKLCVQNEKLQEQMKKIEENLNQKVDQLLNQIKSNKVKYQKVIEENNVLKRTPPKPVVDHSVEKRLEQKVHILEEELSKSLIRLDVSEKVKAKSELKIKELEADKIKNDANTAKKLKELNVSLRNLQNDKSRLTLENIKLSDALRQAETQCASFNIQLKNLYKEIENKDADNNEKIKGIEKELLVIKKENKVLVEKNTNLNNAFTIDASLDRQDHAGAPNGDVQEEKFTCTKVTLVEHEQILGEKDSEIMQLTSELSTRETEATARVEEKDNEIRALTCKLNNNIKEVEELKEEIKVWHAKNDDLRKKNWKAMEALNNAEMQAADSFSFNSTLLQNIFPSITVDKTLEHTIWMKTFQQKAFEFLKSKADEPISKLKEMTKNLELFETKLDVAMKESAQLAAQLKTEKDLQIKISDKLKESETKFIELQSTYEIKLSELSNELAIQKNKYSDLEKMYEVLQSDLHHNEVKNNQELKERVNSLNIRLAETAEDKTKLESKLKEYQNLLSITDEKLQLLQKSVEEEEKKWKSALSEAKKEIQVLKEKQTSLEYLESKVSEQQTLIDEDIRKNRDLAQTIIKLNGIIKTGQDALAQEQKLVENLKQTLSDRNSLESSNLAQEIEQTSGITSSDVGTSV